ncbi:MAG: PspC domain-containing protein [Gammaproteobacteria bacterium]|nr:PspC domain-containing protein [Gammaproteobacteria bacterium]MDH4312908.1 PspC domain-containing protein [Gammaproteobacteria bacterium]MDH5273936.1 PspC domain-containing protein [Gammaproteobacteria bacterium]
MQRLSITVRLNRSVLQFDEAAHARLERYLAESASLLEGDPDPQEILGDLEQAVADQCTRRMQPGQTVVTVAELEPALEEIGSVQAPGNGPASLTREAPPRSLQQVSQGAVISGVCLGLARYFQLDVTLLRVIAVLLLLGTGGGMILVYLGLMLLMPYAPLQPGGARVRWLPAKCRAFMEFLRAKLGVDRRGRIAA